MLLIEYIAAMEIIDSHCHLDDPRFADDFEGVIERAMAVGVNCFIVPSVRADGWERLAGLAAKYPSIRPAFGLHPWHCAGHGEDDLARLPAYLEHAVAIGECGLDFGSGRASEAGQLHWFRRQLALAAEAGLPLIIHAYKSLDTVLRELKALPQLRGVIHGFNGSRQQAEQIMARGFYLGIGSAVTRPQAGRLRQLVAWMPAEQLLLESDAPDQPGYYHRGERNEPAFLIDTVREVASLRAVDISELLAVANTNAKELFHL